MKEFWLQERGITSTHTPYVLDETVADLAFALLLATARRVAEMDRLVKEGGWKKGQDEELFGMGRIGEAVARRAKLSFEMDVVYYNRKRKLDAEQRYGIQYLPLDELLRTSDFVLLLTPLTPQTWHLMDDDQFARMKKSSVFTNVSRGETLNEQALVRAPIQIIPELQK